ncbi:hypothetical protein DESC_780497 [Desulfosarcina cetonica]|nr:hypothetical protein DESC_780497 [Desulfosarcina cetonica]
MCKSPRWVAPTDDLSRKDSHGPVTGIRAAWRGVDSPVCNQYGCHLSAAVCRGADPAAAAGQAGPNPMPPAIDTHRQRLDCRQQPQPAVALRYPLGCPGPRQPGCERLVHGGGQSSILGGYPGPPESFPSPHSVS